MSTNAPMSPFGEGEGCHESQLDHRDRRAFARRTSNQSSSSVITDRDPIAAPQNVVAQPCRERSQDFSACKTTDWRHILTTIGVKCDDGIIGTRGLSS